MEDKRIISFYSYVEYGNYYISISNNGPMISEKHLNQIFERGFSTKKKNEKDHGYGLYIVNELVNKNSGSIEVTSDVNNTEFLLKFNVKEGYYNETINSVS